MIYLCLRFLREFEKWSWIEKIGKNRAKMGKNGCPKPPKYTLLTSVRLKNIFTAISRYPTGNHEIHNFIIFLF